MIEIYLTPNSIEYGRMGKPRNGELLGTSSHLNGAQRFIKHQDFREDRKLIYWCSKRRHSIRIHWWTENGNLEFIRRGC